MNQELIDFAEEVRRRSVELLARALNDADPPTDPFSPEGELLTPVTIEPGSIAALAAGLCDFAGNTVRQAQMLAEREEGYELRDLAAAMTGQKDELTSFD